MSGHLSGHEANQLLEAAEMLTSVFPPRDYRKEAWIAAFTASLAWPGNQCDLTPEQVAENMLVEFDKAFPS